jgi:competence protein ComGC
MKSGRHPILLFALCLISASILLVGSSAHADVPTVLSGHRDLGVYLNLGSSYQLLIEAVKNIDTPQNAALKGQLEALFSTAVLNFKVARGKSLGAKCRTNLHNLAMAVKMHDMEAQKPMTDLDVTALIEGKYLPEELKCPQDGKYAANGNLAEGGEIGCSVHGAAARPHDGPDVESPIKSVTEVCQRILEFHQKGLFQPNGGLWLGADLNAGLAFFIEAEAKPAALIAFIEELGEKKLPKPASTPDGALEFSLPGLTPESNPSRVTLGPKGLLVQIPHPEAKDAATPSWQEFQATARRPGTRALFELHFEKLRTRIPAKPLPLPNPHTAKLLAEALQDIVTLRGSSDQHGSRLLARFADPALKERCKHDLTNQLGIFKPLLEKLIYDQMMQLPEESRDTVRAYKELVASVEVLDEGAWLGVSGKGLPEHSAALVPAITGILAAIAIPNFTKARESARIRACQANMRVLMGAVEMWNMDHGTYSETLDLKTLGKDRYLLSPVECPDGGTYSLETTGKDNFRIRCTIHGTPPQ